MIYEELLILYIYQKNDMLCFPVNGY